MIQLEVVLLPLLIILLNGTDGYAMPKKMVHPNKSSNRDPPICKTPECYAAADQLIQSMDLSVSPCEDFFRFACGGWIEKHPIPSTKSNWNQFDALADEVNSVLKSILEEDLNVKDAVPINSARKMYKACMSSETIENVGLKPLTDLLATFGGWPMTQSQWSEGSFNWNDVSATARKFYDTFLLIRVYNRPHSRDTSHNIIYVDQGPLALPRSILADPEESAVIMTAYAEYIKGAARAVRDALQSQVTDEEIDQQVVDTLKFETDLAKITTREEDRRNSTRLYNPFSLLELQQWTDSIGAKASHAQIDWLKYIGDVYSLADVSVSNDERLIVEETEYLKKLIALLESTEPRTIANYILWRLVDKLMIETSKQMVDLSFEFTKVIFGTSQPEPRWRDCTEKVNTLWGFAVGAKYVERYFDDDSKTQVTKMIGNLKTAFKSLLDESSWMDAATKSIALEKVDVMREFVAYPDWITNQTALENYYAGLKVNVENHFQNIENAIAFINKEEFKDLRRKTDRAKWLSHPSVVEAFYEAEYNSITFPAGILQRPYFANGRIEAVNYGAIGTVIGHEITHGFDDQGRQSDKDGNTIQWWTNETLKKYLRKAQCFIVEYSNQTVPSGTRLNGVNTEGENIADNGGLREAFRAYNYHVAANGQEARLPGLEQLTNEQIFFLSYANVWCGAETKEGLENQITSDPHSPGVFRANIPLRNCADFHHHFNCPVGSAMNPGQMCVLW